MFNYTGKTDNALCPDPTYPLCSYTFSFSCSFPLNCSAIVLKGEVKHHKYQAAQHTQEGFIFLQYQEKYFYGDFYGALVLAELDSGAGFCPLDFALLSFLFSHLFLEKLFCIASRVLAHTLLVPVKVLCSLLLLLMQESSSKTSSFPI